MRRTSAEKTSCSCRSDAARLYSLHPQHDPWRAAPLAWRTRSHDNGLLGLQTTAAWPLAARAQQPVPIIGFLHSQSPDGFTEPLRGFRQGLKDTGYVEGENVAIEYRFADNQMERLPELAAELVHR